MRTPRQVWEEERDDPWYWMLWVAGVMCIALVVLEARVVVWLTEPEGIVHLGKHCDVKPYTDPRCVRAEDVQ